MNGLIALILIYSLNTFANYCDDFQSVACGQSRPFMDGTNSFKRRSQTEISNVLENNSQDILKQFELEAINTLNTSDPNQSLAFHVWKVAKLDQKPQLANCFNADAQPAPKRVDCTLAINRAFTQYVRATFFWEIPVDLPFDDPDYIDQIMSSPEVLNFRNNYAKKIELASIPESTKSKLDDKFANAKTALIDKIKNLPIAPEIQKKMQLKIKNMTLNIESCNALGDALFAPNAFYSATDNKINICPSALLESDSSFSIYTTLVHEMAHSFDPCYLGLISDDTALSNSRASSFEMIQKLDSYSPVKELTECLRAKSSVEAKVCTIESLVCNFGDEEAKHICETRNELYEDSIKVCSDSDLKDQAAESISDWFAAELVPSLIENENPNLKPEQWKAGFSNAISVLCKDPDLEKLHQEEDFSNGYACESHPQSKPRINAIFATNPNIRKKLGCNTPQPQFKYCSFDKNSTSNNISTKHLNNTPQSDTNKKLQPLPTSSPPQNSGSIK